MEGGGEWGCFLGGNDVNKIELISTVFKSSMKYVNNTQSKSTLSPYAIWVYSIFNLSLGDGGVAPAPRIYLAALLVPLFS